MTHHKKPPALTFKLVNVSACQMSKETSSQPDKATPSKQLDRKWDGGGRKWRGGEKEGSISTHL